MTPIKAPGSLNIGKLSILKRVQNDRANQRVLGYGIELGRRSRLMKYGNRVTT
jgi:hypothetical protein